MTDTVPLAELTAEHFTPLTGKRFVAGSTPMILLEVTTHADTTLPRARRTNFALLFRQPEGAPLPSGQHRLQHETLAAADPVMIHRVMPPAAYLEPGVFDNSAYYEVLFN